MQRHISELFIITLFASLLSFHTIASGTGIGGRVKDAKTGEALAGANIILVGTSKGAASDLEGKYYIANVPAGTYTIRVSYIGYSDISEKVTVADGGTTTKNFKMVAVSVQGEEVVITAQAIGQTQAINQQLSADQIMNAVSAAKIQELPDANAAESVGRLPGVSVLRSGGEGTEVVIRGLAPKYNKILIDGIQMSASDPDDRSTDLSMVSSNMLEGIQVSKSVTPDMDADVIGGTVNFSMREAKTKEPGVPQFGLLMQGSYNNLSNAYNKYNNYKYVASVENRFLGELLGVFVQLDMERKNLSSNEMGADYKNVPGSITDYWTTGVNLNDIPRDRQRYNGAVVLDYRIPDGKIKFENFFSSGSTNVLNRGEVLGIEGNTHEYDLSSSNSKLNIITNGLDYQQQLPFFQMDAKLSHTYSETKDPKDWSLSFLQSSAGLNQYSHVANLNPQSVAMSANDNFDATYLQNIVSNNSFSRERALTASVDLKTTYNFNDLVSAEIKVGGKYRYQTRSYTYEEYNGQSANGGSAGFVDSLVEKYFSLPYNSRLGVPMTYFIDPKYSYGKFMDGDYKMAAPLNSAMLSSMVDYLQNNLQYIANNNGAVTYARNNYLSQTSNYSGDEYMSAFYVMSIVNIGSEITVIPGVRYQNLITKYTGSRGNTSPESFYSYNHYDTTAIQAHGYWLPDVSVKYKPVSWFDVRLSYTNTLSYPDFSAIIPRIDMSGNWIGWINYKLKPSRSTNYDAYFSFYDNTVGLFTVGTFLKQIDNLIYPWSFNVAGANVIPYLPWSLTKSYNGKTTYGISTYVNDSYRINDYGVELDWQTHFWYLPGPLSGLVFSVNYTHIFSKAQYPYTYTLVTRSSIKYIDTSFVNRLLYQPNDIANMSLGFDYKGFSIRGSLLYQADIFTSPNFWPQLRGHTAAYKRWDLAVKQELPWYGIQVYGDINNINGANDVSIIQGGGVPMSEQDYGLTADMGLRITL